MNRYLFLYFRWIIKYVLVGDGYFKGNLFRILDFIKVKLTDNKYESGDVGNIYIVVMYKVLEYDIYFFFIVDLIGIRCYSGFKWD